MGLTTNKLSGVVHGRLVSNPREFTQNGQPIRAAYFPMTYPLRAVRFADNDCQARKCDSFKRHGQAKILAAKYRHRAEMASAKKTKYQRQIKFPRNLMRCHPRRTHKRTLLSTLNCRLVRLLPASQYANGLLVPRKPTCHYKLACSKDFMTIDGPDGRVSCYAGLAADDRLLENRAVDVVGGAWGCRNGRPKP